MKRTVLLKSSALVGWSAQFPDSLASVSPAFASGRIRAGAIGWGLGTLFWCVLACSLLAVPLLAQLDTGTITVTVKDASGSAVPGAAATLRNENTGITVRSGSTNGQGVFTAALIPSGSYSVHVEVRGFKSYEQSAIYLQVNEELSVPVSLQVGEMNEQVTVTSTAPLVTVSMPCNVRHAL